MSTEVLRNSVAKKFLRAAELEQRGASPLYERLSLGIARDPILLRLAAEARHDQPIPNLFFAAVHFLLLSGVRHELAKFYPTATGRPGSTADPLPHFRRFCLEYSDEIKRIIKERRVQTNVVERCGLLFPAFGITAERADHKPLHMIEIGCSAGLNLLWDKYCYSYGTGRIYGNSTSRVQIDVETHGMTPPTLTDATPHVLSRVGIDLEPIDVNDDESMLWLRALVWPEDYARLQRMNSAISIAQSSPPAILKGNALELLPAELADVPSYATPIVYHTHTVNQFSTSERQLLDDLLSDVGRRRDLYWISSEYRASPRRWLTDKAESVRPTLKLVSFESAVRRERTLARCHHHGRWIEWLDDQ
ncbi:MAG: DUF2332 domain-containing protein [Chloroflexota bacterium]|nr:DUF2332 domain-containing protein [Chloroflexota bacterium]